MVLLPMENGGQRTDFFQLVERHLKCRAVRPNLSERIAYARHAHPLASEVRERAEIGQRIILAVVRGHHADAGRTTVHLVELTSGLHLLYITLISCLISIENEQGTTFHYSCYLVSVISLRTSVCDLALKFHLATSSMTNRIYSTVTAKGRAIFYRCSFLIFFIPSKMSVWLDDSFSVFMSKIACGTLM